MTRDAIHGNTSHVVRSYGTTAFCQVSLPILPPSLFLTTSIFLSIPTPNLISIFLSLVLSSSVYPFRYFAVSLFFFPSNRYTSGWTMLDTLSTPPP